MSENEEKRTLCEDCGQSDAVCTVAVMMGSQVMHRRLCQACMAKASMSIATGNLGSVLGAIMAAARNAAQAAQAQQGNQAQQTDQAKQHQAMPGARPQPGQTELPELPGEAQACPQCGMAYADFRREGRLGCAACATAFRQTLLAALSKNGSVPQHTGRKPLMSRDAVQSRARQVELQRQMDEAIACEDYETAARLRDEIREMNGREDRADE